MTHPSDAEVPLATRATEPAGNGLPLSLSDRVRSLRLPDQAARPPAPSRLLWLLCLALAGTSGYLGYRLSTAPQPSADDGTPAPTASAGTGGEAEASPASRGMTSGGFIVPVRRVQVSPKVGGQVESMRFQEGDYVKAGEVLAKIDPKKYKYAYDRMAALAEQMKAEHEKADPAWREADEYSNQLGYELAVALRSREATPRLELNTTRSRREQAVQRAKALNTDIKRAYHNWKNAEAMRDDARYDLDNTEVLAPVSGTILKKYAEEGNMVRPEAFSNGLSASLYDMANLKELEVDIDVPERDIELVHKGQRCEVWAEAFPKKIYGGYVSRLMPEAERSKASIYVRVRIEIPDDDDLLRPQMRARVRFLPEDGKKKDAGKK